MNKFDEMRQAMNEARATVDARNTFRNDLLDLIYDCDLRGSNRHSQLIALKKQLAKYNIHTRRWKP